MWGQGSRENLYTLLSFCWELKTTQKEKVFKKIGLEKKRKLSEGTITREGPPGVLTGRMRNHFLGWGAGPAMVLFFEMYTLDTLLEVHY